MAGIPSLKRTWQFNINNVISPTVSDPDWNMCHDVLLTIINGMSSFVSGAWGVVSSSSGYTTSPEPAPWVQAGLTWHLNSGSWVTLSQSHTSPPTYLCFYTQNFHYSDIYLSSVGFSGGTGTTRPTAVDEVLIGSPYFVTWYVGNNNNVVHLMQSTDGKHFICVTCRLTGTTSVMFTQELPAHADVWNTPTVGYAYGGGYDSVYAISFETFFASPYWYSGLVHVMGYYSGALPLSMTSDYVDGSQFVAYLPSYRYSNPGYNELTQQYELYRIGLATNTLNTNGRYWGRFGTLDDMYVGAKNLSLGSTYSNDLIHWGKCQLVTPWSGSVIMSY